MKKPLIGIPCLYHGHICLKAFKSVIDEADLLIIDNGGDRSVKHAIGLMREEYGTPRVNLIANAENKYVNPAWCQILKYFLASDYEQLIIMNSDLIMMPGWSEHLVDGEICIPTDGSHTSDIEVFEGTAGVFIHLNKEMANLVYPIPESIKIWFGDNVIFGKLRKSGYKTIIKSKLIATHYQNGSQTVKILPGISELIELDKLAWAEIEKTL